MEYCDFDGYIRSKYPLSSFDIIVLVENCDYRMSSLLISLYSGLDIIVLVERCYVLGVRLEVGSDEGEGMSNE